MPLDPERALSAALLARLRADPGVAAIVAARVHDQPPPETPHPWLHLGRVETRVAGGAPAEGVELMVTLTAVSTFGGKEEALALNAAVREALHDAELAPGDHRLVLLHVLFQDVFRAADWRAVYGVSRVRAVLEPIAALLAEAA